MSRKTEAKWKQEILTILKNYYICEKFSNGVYEEYKTDEDFKEFLDDIYKLMKEYAEENPVEAEPDTSHYECMKELD